jgi:hypothetical protein
MSHDCTAVQLLRNVASEKSLSGQSQAYDAQHAFTLPLSSGQFRLNQPISTMSEEISPWSSSYPGSAFQALIRHFESNEFVFHADPETQAVQLFLNGESAVYSCRFQISHEEGLLQVRIAYPVSARNTKIRPLVAEMVHRTNHDMSLGGFEIDMDTGEVEYSVGQVIRGQGLDDDLIGGIFASSLGTADRYFPALMRVMFAGYTPADSVYLSELDIHADSIEDEERIQAPAPTASKPPAKRTRAVRKDPRLKFTRELPGLFDDPSGDQDRESRKI